MTQETDAIYDAAVAASTQEAQAQKAMQARASFALAVDTDADAYAEAQRVARRTGVPVGAVMSNPKEMKRQDKVGSVDFESLAKLNPITAGILVDVERARLMHDDVEQLTGFESFMRSAGRLAKGSGQAFATAIPRFNKGAYGLLQYGAELLPESVGGSVARFSAEQAAANQETIDRWMPKASNIYEQSWYSGMASSGSMAVDAAAAFATGGATLPLMGARTAGEAYHDARQKGVSPGMSAWYGAGQGLVEAGTEQLSFGALKGMFNPKTALGKQALEYVLKEQLGEQIATHLQDLNEQTVLHPEKTLEDYLRDRPNAAAQTALSTLFASGAQTAVAKSAQLVSRFADGKQAQIDQAEQSANTVQGINKLAAAIKLAQRSPEDFAEFAQAVADDNDSGTLYIDASALLQTGVAEQVAALSPAVAEQLQEAAQTGGQIAIPAGEYAATLARSEYAGQLVEHIKTGPDDWSKAEAREWQESGEGSLLQREMDRIMAERENDDAFKQSAKVVQDNVRQQLEAAQGYTPEQRDANAALFSRVIAAAAARIGMTPEELYQKRLLRVQAETPTFSAQTFTSSRAYNQLVDVEGHENRGRDRIQSLAEWAKEQLEKEGFLASVEHSGSAAGPSSYITVEDPQTGSRLNNQLRFSGHSKGAYQSQFVNNLGSEAEVLSLIDELKAWRTPERVSAFAAFKEQVKANEKEQQARHAQALATEAERLQRAEAKEANGEALSNMDRKVLKARDEGRLLRDGGSKYLQAQSALNQAKEQFASLVDRFVQGDVDAAVTHEILPTSTDSMRMLGLPDLPVRIGSHALDALYNHGVTPTQMKQLIDELENPRMVMIWNRGRGGETSLNFVTSMHNAKGEPFVIGMHPARGSRQGRHHWVATVTEKQPRAILDMVRDGGALYVGYGEIAGISDKELRDALRFAKEKRGKQSRDLKAVMASRDGLQNLVRETLYAKDLERVKSSNPNILHQRTQQTKAAYEARIDELFAGEKANRQGARVLDRSDVMGLLGHPGVPLVLAETHLIDGMTNHPEMTAEQWKKVPEWLDNPAAVYADRERSDTRLTVIAPERLIGKPVVMAVELKPVSRHDPRGEKQLLVTVFAKTTGELPGLKSLAESGRLLYMDTKKAPVAWPSTWDNPKTVNQASRARKILTEKNLAGYRKEHGDVLFAGQSDVTRGFFDPGSNTIGLLKDANASTFIHEAGHYFVEMYTQLATQLQQKTEALTEGEQGLLDDVNVLLKWAGVEGGLQAWNGMDMEARRSAHEQIARGQEAYLFEGKAPTQELTNIFRQMAAWLKQVYRDLRALNVELSDEVRGVFDRMIASGDEIVRTEQSRALMPLFESAEAAGMTPEEYAGYQQLALSATQAAMEELQARGLMDMKWLRNAHGRELKRLQRESREIRKAVQEEVRQEVMQQPVYMAWDYLTKRRKDTKRLSTSEVQAMYADKPGLADALQQLGMLAENGAHPDIVADLFGFDSGDAMIQDFLRNDPPQDTIEAMTDARMLEEHGDLATPEAVAEAADQAVHNAMRARVLATEANALAKATGGRKLLLAAAKEYAQAAIDRMLVRDVRPRQHTNAAERAGRKADAAFRKGDTQQAAALKRQQVLQHELARAAASAQEEVDAGLRYLKKFDGAVKGLDTEYADQIYALLERFDLRKGQSLKAIDQRKSLTKWIEEQREAGLEPDISPEMENEAYRKSYKDMTVQEMRELLETVRQIEHLGLVKNRLLTAAKQREYTVARDEIVAGIKEHAHGRQADNRTPVTALGNLLKSLKNFGAAHIKAASWARIMDGNKDGGPVWEYFIRQANVRGDMETIMRAEATAKLSAILSPVIKLGKMGGKGVYFESIGKSLNREQRIAIALNMGNEGNTQRLLGGEGWTLAQIQPILQSLTSTEWQAVQAVWDHFESYREQIAAKEKRVYGKEPQWVEPRPFTVTTADGQTMEIQGGYYPIKYDPSASMRAENHNDAEAARRQLQGAYTSSTTRRSFTKSRVAEVQGRPLLYSFSGIYSGVNDVIHDLAWHEWLIDTNKLMKSQTIDAAIRQHYGPEVKQQLKQWVQDIAEGDRGSSDAVERALARVRQGVSVAGLGFNVVSAAMQPLGLTQSVVRVGARWIGIGVAKYISNPIGLTKQINSMSAFMENRSRTRFRDLNELRNQVQQVSAAKDWMSRNAYVLMMRAQQMVDTPTWWGAYEKAMAEGNDEARAIDLADQAVIDAQGGGQTKDLSGVERGGAYQKLFTTFYSFMNTALNLGVMQTMGAHTPTQKAKLAADYLLLYVVPPVLGAMLRAGITPGDSDDFEDPEKMAKALTKAQIEYLMGLMVVVREASVLSDMVGDGPSFGYQGPGGLRPINDAVKFAQQAKQGEFDEAFWRSAINLTGSATGIPSAQLNRSIKGGMALAEGDTENPAALVFGYQEPR